MDILVNIIQTWLVGLLALLFLQFFIFLYAYNHKRIDIIDVFWGPSFILVGCLYAVINISNLNYATYIAFVCISIWGLRLSKHIFSRFILSKEQDKRYTEITRSFIDNPLLVYIKVFAMQAVLANLVMTVFMVATLSSKYSQVLSAGFVLWLFGFVFESIADAQLKNHIAAKTGSIMTTGLWRYSRHPNYFGELVQWWAIWLMVSGGEYSAIGLIGPLLISFLIIFISGIPPLERHMASKVGWGSYKKYTSIIIPWLKFR